MRSGAAVWSARCYIPALVFMNGSYFACKDFARIKCLLLVIYMFGPKDASDSLAVMHIRLFWARFCETAVLLRFMCAVRLSPVPIVVGQSRCDVGRGGSSFLPSMPLGHERYAILDRCRCVRAGISPHNAGRFAAPGD